MRWYWILLCYIAAFIFEYVHSSCTDRIFLFILLPDGSAVGFWGNSLLFSFFAGSLTVLSILLIKYLIRHTLCKKNI